MTPPSHSAIPLAPFDATAYTGFLAENAGFIVRRDAQEPHVSGSFNYSVDPLFTDAVTRRRLVDFVRAYCADAGVHLGSLRPVQPLSKMATLTNALLPYVRSTPPANHVWFLNDVTINSNYVRNLIGNELAMHKRVGLVSLLVRDSPTVAGAGSPSAPLEAWLAERAVPHHVLATSERVGVQYLALHGH
jgi:hypothetical protein